MFDIKRIVLIVVGLMQNIFIFAAQYKNISRGSSAG